MKTLDAKTIIELERTARVKLDILKDIVPEADYEILLEQAMVDIGQDLGYKLDITNVSRIRQEAKAQKQED